MGQNWDGLGHTDPIDSPGHLPLPIGNATSFLRIDGQWIVPSGGGTEGPQGPSGPEGPEGPQGIPGATGSQGIQGIQGATGSQGIQGIQGVSGDPGAAGADGNDGVGVPTGGAHGQVLGKASGTNFDTIWIATGSASIAWGGITGTLSNQSDLNTSLGGKAASSHTHDVSDVTGISGTPDSTTFLRGDAAWASPTGSGNPIDSWPIGSVFISVVSTSPATLLGGGTWVAFGAGRVLVGLDAGQTEFDTVE